MNVPSFGFEWKFYNPLQKIFNDFFELVNVPYVCKLQVPVGQGKGKMDMVIYKVVGYELREMILVEVKVAGKSFRDGEDQLINYSTLILDSDKQRYLVLSMMCSQNQFAFFCAFRFKGSVAFVQISKYDNFSFGSNGLGLLKLLYILELPWPIYGSMVVNDKTNGTLSVWLQNRYLGSGSSAEVFEYIDNNNRSRAVKFFRSICDLQFSREVEIYTLLASTKGVSLKMVFCDIDRLIICTSGARKVVKISEVSPRGIASVYESLRLFHRITKCIHRDIYHNNILQISNDQLVLNDFGLSTPENKTWEIKGNVYFASDNVLMSCSDYFTYSRADDIYSLTFSLIYLLHRSQFSDYLNEDITDKGKIFLSRQRAISSIHNSFLAFEALNFAKKGDYIEARNYIIKFSGK
jgi:serine/threonine protein kinase